jgi:hypothetical protein
MSLTGTIWAPIGPSPILQGATQVNGLVSAIAVNPNNSNLIYQGTAGGGVWRTTDGGTTWRPLFDHQLTLGIGEPSAIAIDPTNTDTIYVGTGQRITLGTGNAAVFGPPDLSQGLFKSTDGGGSWIQLGSGFPAGNTGNALTFVGQSINVVIVDPASPNTLYLACTAGVFRSIDGGQNWTRGTGFAADTRSLVLDTSSPANARILYAGVSGQGVFTSTDGGGTWNRILSATTPAVQTALGGTAGAGFNKVVVDIAPPTSPPNAAGVQVLYVSLEGTGGAPDPVGVFRSTDQGGTWTQRSATGMPTNTQGGYSFHMAVDPASPGDGNNDIIYFGAVGLAKSTDSGLNFAGLAVPHSDCHAWAFFPQPSPTPSVVYSGNDGGLVRSTDGGTTWQPLASGGLQTGLIYNIDIRPDATGSVIVGAAQDNGLLTTAGVAAPAWSSPEGGDGFDVAYDGVTAGRVYGTSGFWPAPCTRVFASGVDGTDFPPTVPSPREITPWGTASDQNCGVFPITGDPSNAGVVYASGNQNLWQTRNGGTNWRILRAFGGIGNVDVARANGNNVVIAVGNQVFVSTNALAATVGPPTGVTFTNITRNLPNRTVTRAAFDPSDPTVIFAVLGGFNGGFGQNGHVFRTTIAGTAWTDISPVAPLDPSDAVPEQIDLPFNAIALDGAETPTTIYVGTDLGVLRSVDNGASWSVVDDVHFPRVPVTDLVINPAAGALCAATYGRGVFRLTKPTGPAVAVNLEENLSFGTVCGGPSFQSVTVYNVGGADLVVNSVQRLMGSTDFVVLSTPSTPLIVSPGDEVEFTVQYTPSAPGASATAVLRISTNDPTAPVVDIVATGLAGTGALETVIADQGRIGEVCLGSFVEEELTIHNNGPCPLTVFNITSSSAEFVVASVDSFPLVIGAGDSIDVPIRFEPASFGAKSATISIDSDDPGGLRTVAVSGVALTPTFAMFMADAGDFGPVCVGSFLDEDLTLNNSGDCALIVSNIASSSAEFIVPQVLSYPLKVASGCALEVPIRFEPASFGPKAATITITSNDPAGPRSINVSGHAPTGKLAVTGVTNFGCVECGERVHETLAICNVGECDLHVAEVAFEHKHGRKQKCGDFKLVHNPFPATLRPGSCLGLVIQFEADCDPPTECELVIISDDPDTPKRTLEVKARSACWPCCNCRPEGCKERRCPECERRCCKEEREDNREERRRRREHEPYGKERRDEDEEEREEERKEGRRERGQPYREAPEEERMRRSDHEAGSHEREDAEERERRRVATEAAIAAVERREWRKRAPWLLRWVF